MVKLADMIAHLDEFLAVDKVRDYCPNGLQIESVAEVNKIVTGVSANMDLIQAAVSNGADTVLVHHGFFWKGEEQTISGIKGGRIRSLIKNDINLLAYHLPLDIHPQVGNNVLLAERMGVTVDGSFGRAGNIDLGIYGRLLNSLTAVDLQEKLELILGRVPEVIGSMDKLISTVGICTGAAQDFIEEAASVGVDAFISGEISERTPHMAKELGINYFTAGHHATEKFGIQALGEYLAEKFEVEVEFVDIANNA